MTPEEKRDAMDLLESLYDENLYWSDGVRIVATALREAEARGMERAIAAIRQHPIQFIRGDDAAVAVTAAVHQCLHAIRAEKERKG